MAPTPTDLRSDALAYASALDVETMSGEAAARAVKELSVAENAVATARMFLASRVAQTNAWRGQGHASAADWLAAQIGITVSAAHAQLGTARKAKKLSKTKKAMDEGKLSPTQADAVTDGATADPSAEDDLLSSAKNDTTRNLKDKAAKTRAAATDSKERERRIRRQRSLRMHTDADGAFNLHLRGPATDGARLAAMLKPFQEEAFRAARTRGSVDGVKDTFDNREYDAFWNLLDHLNTLAQVATHLAGQPPAPAPADTPNGQDTPEDTAREGEAGPEPASPSSGPPNPIGEQGSASDRRRSDYPPGTDPPGPEADPLDGLTPGQRTALARKLPGGNNTKVIINIDLTAYRRGHTEAGETCHIAGLGPISVDTAKQLMDDAFIAAVIKDGTQIHTVTHYGRGLNAHQRTALEAAGIRCTNIACNQTVAIQIDHRVPYAEDPVTHLSNQDPLCPNCHRQKTHHNHHLEPGTGPRRLLPPRDRAGSRPGTGPADGPGDATEQASQEALL